MQNKKPANNQQLQERFQPRQKPEPQQDMWYTPLPIEALWGIYARQSSLGQVLNNIESTEMQTDDLIKWLVDRLVPQQRISLFDADLGVSGALRIDQRTGLQELVECIQEEEIKAVLVYQVSRLFRDETGVQYNVFANICKQHNCLLFTADGTAFNFNNSMHLKMFRFLAEMAADYIPQQIKLLHAARLRKARKGIYAGLGTVPSGYIVDYTKSSPTYRKFIPYWPHAEIVHYFFQRYFALNGNFQKLCRELDEYPYIFPPFEAWVDQRNVSRWERRKVPGGYKFSRDGLAQLLTNPVYIGWWIVTGDIISRNNHERIISVEDEDLFWYAFDRLSPYTTDGEENTKRELLKEPRRFYQTDTIEKKALLKDRVEYPDGSITVHIYRNREHYCLTPPASMRQTGRKEIEASLVDAEFTDLFFTRLKGTQEFEVFKQWIAEETQKRNYLLATINEQLAEIDSQQEDILSERLALRKQINAIQDEEEKNQAEEATSPTFQRLLKRSMTLDTLQKNLLKKKEEAEKNETLDTARKYADFQTELRKLIPVWDSKPFEVRQEFVNLFVKKATLTLAASHWIQLDIHWAHPAWGSDTLYIHRKFGSSACWTAKEREIIKTHYVTCQREEILQLLPDKSWWSIRKEAVRLGVKREEPGSSPISLEVSWSDWCFMQEHGLVIEDDETCTKNEGVLELYL